MQYPKQNWVSSFSNGELDQFKPTGEKILLVGIDTEYTRQSEFTNLCLSYQFAVLDCRTGIYQKKIYFPDLGSAVRLTLREILMQVFNIVGISPEDISGYHVKFVCHFCSAEMSMLRDREEVAKHLDYLYKTAITFKPIALDFAYSEIHTCEITFEVSDTMLLLPPTHRSLDKASSLLNEKYHKKELTADEKENMDVLLKNNKGCFEEYAIHDVDITLRLFIKLQYTLNLLNGSVNVRYTTIGNATVKQFKQGMDTSLFKSQFSKMNTLYQKGLSLTKRAYMGGLNSSYYIGERKGELFLDIDFSSAYPVCMNLLEISDFGKPFVKPKADDFSLGDLL